MEKGKQDRGKKEERRKKNDCRKRNYKSGLKESRLISQQTKWNVDVRKKDVETAWNRMKRIILQNAQK